MSFYALKKTGALLLTATMVASVAACGNSKQEEKNSKEITTQQKEESSSEQDTDYIAEDVVLPMNFDNMIYPMEALAVEYYSKGHPYYTEGKDSESFWFSMAVLSSLMADKGMVDPDIENGYAFCKKDEINMYASAMYDDFGNGTWELPKLPEDDTYAYYEEDKGEYGLLRGNIGDLGLYITYCENYKEGYILDTELRNRSTGSTEAQFQFVIQNTSSDIKDNLFSYSISEMYPMGEMGDDSDDSEQERTTSEAAETTTIAPEESTTETEGQEDVSESTTEVQSEEEDDVDEESEGASDIGQSEALDRAKDYMGGEAEYSFKQMVTIGNAQYYDFSVKGEDISATDVLVSLKGGNDVVSATQNDDGSWSFDQ